MTNSPGIGNTVFEIALNRDFFSLEVLSVPQYALLNYKEIMEWHRIPWYRRIFITKPVKMFIEIKIEDEV